MHDARTTSRFAAACWMVGRPQAAASPRWCALTIGWRTCGRPSTPRDCRA